jgi:hypothetical protein
MKKSKGIKLRAFLPYGDGSYISIEQVAADPRGERLMSDWETFFFGIDQGPSRWVGFATQHFSLPEFRAKPL